MNKMTDEIRQLGREKVRKGKSKIPLKIPDEVPRGEYPLRIEYEENEKYTKSDAYGTLRHYHKVWIHLPTIYVYKQYEDTATIKANLYADNSPVNHGRGKFKVQNVTVSDEIQVTNGHAEYNYNITQYRNGPRTKLDTIFAYGGSSTYLFSPGYGEGVIAFLNCHKGGIPLKMHTYPLIYYHGGNVMLVCRVYKLQHSNAINDIDIPDEGSIRWIINGKIVGTSQILESGFSLLEYNVTQEEGIYEVTCEYIPVKDSEKYCSPKAAESLYVQREDIGLSHATATIPPQKLDTTCTFTAHFTNIENIDTVQLFIDDQLCHLTSVSNTEYKQKITNEDTTFSFIIPPEATATKLWAYPGTHIIRWGYVHKELGVYLEEYMTSFIITHPTHIHFDDIGRDDDYDCIYNGVEGVPIVLPDVEGNVVDTDYPDELVNEGQFTLVMDKMTPNLSLTSADLTLKVDDTGSYTAHLESNTTVDMPDRSVLMSWDGDTKTSITDDIGDARFDCKFTNAGIIPCNITYNGNDYEEQVQKDFSVTVLKRPTVMELTSTANWRKNTSNTLFVDDTVTLNIQLNEDIGDAVPNATVTIYDVNNDGWSKNLTTNKNGKATTSFKITEDRVLNLYAVFEEDRKYLSSRAVADKLIVVMKYTPQITTSTTDVDVDDDITIQIDVVDDLGNPIQGLEINKMITSNTHSIGTTDKNGQLTYTEHATKKGQMTFNFNNTETSHYYKSHATQVVNISALPLAIQISGNPTSLGVNQESYQCIIEKIIHGKEEPVPGAEITVNITNQPNSTHTLTTDNNGVAIFNQVYTKKGSHTITITVSETDEYDTTSASFEVTSLVANPTITPNINSQNMSVLDEEELWLTVYDETTNSLLQDIPVSTIIYNEGGTNDIISNDITDANGMIENIVFTPMEHLSSINTTGITLLMFEVSTDIETIQNKLSPDCVFIPVTIHKISITPTLSYVCDNEGVILSISYDYPVSEEFLEEYPPQNNGILSIVNENKNVNEHRNITLDTDTINIGKLEESSYGIGLLYTQTTTNNAAYIYDNIYWMTPIKVEYPKIITDDCTTTENWLAPVGCVPQYNSTLLDNETVFKPFNNYWNGLFWKYPLKVGVEQSLEFDVYLGSNNDNYLGLTSLKQDTIDYQLNPIIKISNYGFSVNNNGVFVNLYGFVINQWNHIKLTLYNDNNCTVQCNDNENKFRFIVDKVSDLDDYLFLFVHDSNENYPVYLDNISLTNYQLDDYELTDLLIMYIEQFSDDAIFPETNMISRGVSTGNPHNLEEWTSKLLQSTAGSLPVIDEGIFESGRYYGSWWTKTSLSKNCTIYTILKTNVSQRYSFGICTLDFSKQYLIYRDTGKVTIITPSESTELSVSPTLFSEYIPLRIIISDGKLTFNAGELFFQTGDEVIGDDDYYFFVRTWHTETVCIKDMYYIDYE